MIKVDQVSKKIEARQVLDRVSFEVGDGEIVGLIGPNGAGKTTILNIIAGVWPADSGKVLVNGKNTGLEDPQVKTEMGYIPDAPFYYPRLSGREFLRFVGGLYGLSREKIAERSEQLIQALELSPWMEELMEGYPRGVRQKATFAAMLLHSPRTIILDEPLTNLDPKSSRLVKELLQRLSASGCAILFSTHILEIAEKLCRRVVVIDQGKVIADGTLQELRLGPGGGTGNLEELFLGLTGGSKYSDLLKYLG
jgi:ABC-2 type transport system ATP-binding protein